MENMNGNTGAAVGVVAADSGSATDDRFGVQIVDPLRYAETCVERAQDRLRYGRRQEAEEAISILDEARFGIAAARAAGQG